MPDPKWFSDDKTYLSANWSLLSDPAKAMLKRSHAHIAELRCAGGMATEYEEGGWIERGGILTLKSILEHTEPPEVTNE